jgi:hypothetical protein
MYGLNRPRKTHLVEGTGFSPYIQYSKMDGGFSPGRTGFAYFCRDPEFFRNT